MSEKSEKIVGDKVRVTSRTGITRKFVWEFEENKSRVLDTKREGSILELECAMGAALVGGQMNKTV